MLGSCAAGGQLWDVKDPWNPTTNVPGKYTLINSPGGGDGFEFIHSGIFNVGREDVRDDGRDRRRRHRELLRRRDRRRLLLLLRRGEAGQARPEARGPLLDPASAGRRGVRVAQRVGDPGQAPRPDDRGVLPGRRHGRRLHRSRPDPRGRLRGPGRTRPARPTSGRRTGTTAASSPTAASTGATSNRGVDVYRPSGDLARLTRRAERWSHSNPQTQEAWQAP